MVQSILPSRQSPYITRHLGLFASLLSRLSFFHPSSRNQIYSAAGWRVSKDYKLSYLDEVLVFLFFSKESLKIIDFRNEWKPTQNQHYFETCIRRRSQKWTELYRVHRRQDTGGNWSKRCTKKLKILEMSQHSTTCHYLRIHVSQPTGAQS